MERVMSILINQFSKYDNVELHLILIGNKREVAYELPNSVLIHKPKWEFNNRYRNIDTLRTVIFLRRMVKEIKPNTVLSFGEMWNNLALLALSRTKYPVYISDRSTPNKNLGRLQNFLRDKLYPEASGYIAQTEKAAIVAKKKNWNENIKIIGNPVPKIDLGDVQGKVVLTVGRLIKTKNVDRLIYLFDEARQHVKDKSWKLCVVGGNAAGGSILEDLQAQVEIKNLKDLVLLEGEKSNVRDYLKTSEIFAFTSTSEGFPNALAEAMSAGLAVIAYDCMAGPSDLIDEGINGFLIPEGNEALFAEKLALLMNDAELRKSFGEKAKQKLEKFHETEIALGFFNFITQKPL